VKHLKASQVRLQGGTRSQTLTLAQEAPIAIEINGVGYAVMMATPADLEDFGFGFALSERFVERASQLRFVEPAMTPQGVVLRIGLTPDAPRDQLDRVRNRVSDSACGLCGVESLEQALRPLKRVPQASPPAPAAIFEALEALRQHQPLNAETHATHAAALCAADGSIVMAREDVGRHNAFDKLIGAMARQGVTWDGGFALLTSRCSYELVEKAVVSDCPTLVTVSLATSLAVERAAQAGLRLIMLARSDSYLLA
jgi:FdhD protein